MLYTLQTEIISANKDFYARGEFIGSCQIWQERWTVLDENEDTVATKTVDRYAKSALPKDIAAAYDLWIPCPKCGAIHHTPIERCEWCEFTTWCNNLHQQLS